MQKDQAGKNYWDSVYEGTTNNILNWKPINNAQIELDQVFDKYIKFSKVDNIMEFGCGGSQWLPYLSKKHNIHPMGFDYSEKGVNSAKKNCESKNLESKNILIHDLYKPALFQTNFGYSIGLVEHFTDLDNCILNLKKFVLPGGIIFTQVPNMNSSSLLGRITQWYQPKVYDIHVPISEKKLIQSYTKNNIEILESGYLGIASFSALAYNSQVKRPKINRVVRPILKGLNQLVEILGKLGLLQNKAVFSPYIYIVGKING